MERQLKERLIGAAVLVAAAIILIPEMLSGRGGSADDEPSSTRTATPGETPLKTYSIDLNRSPTTAAVEPESLTTSAPPPEEAPPPEVDTQEAPAQATQAIPESAAGNTAPTIQPPAETTPAPRSDPPPDPRPVPVEPAPARATVADKPAGAGWAVQLGSFSSRATADALAGKLRGEGYDAFVMPVKSGANTLYRVRIGPMADRDDAARVLGKVKGKIPAATVVKHP